MFESDHIPELIVHRDAQLREIAFAVRLRSGRDRVDGCIMRGMKPGESEKLRYKGF